MLPMVQTEPVLVNCGLHPVNAAGSPSDTSLPSLTPESDLDELPDIFFDVNVAVNNYLRVESCDLQLGDTWRGMQCKMSVTTPVKKIRKKSDNKPQSQINKCHNEKRRRELENETINQLEELLGACLADVKQPDKNGIVRETTRQIHEILKRQRGCIGECPILATHCLSPVQAGEITSTQQQPTTSDFYISDLSNLIEGLKHYTNNLGLVLLELNSKGEIECISDNIKEFILLDRTKLYKESIYSILHKEDHEKFKPLLKYIQNFGWGSGDLDKVHVLQVQLVVKKSDGTDFAGYVEAVIHAAAVRGLSSQGAGSVMCVIRRCEDASAALLPDDTGPPAITPKPSDNIVFRLDFCDLSAVENFINSPVTLVGTRYLDLVESTDRARVAAHLKEAACLPAPPAISDPFRLRFTADRPWLRVSARSRLFSIQSTDGELKFIMSTHTVLSDEDMELIEPDGPRPPVGGPLMPSIANGESSTSETRYRSPVSPSETPFLINDFEFEPWTSTLLGDMPSEESKEVKDESSATPSTPVPPRAPSTPGDTAQNAQPAEESNRLWKLLTKKLPASSDSPAPIPVNASTNTAVNSNNRILKDLLKQEDEEATGSETSAPHTPHTPHTPLTPLTPHTPSAALSPLHSAHTQPTSAPTHAHLSHSAHTSHSMHQSHHNTSDVLKKILNDKSDEELDLDSRRNSSDSNRNAAQPCALLTHLLTGGNGSAGNGRSQDINDTYLERIAGVKRKFEEAILMAGNIKRPTPDNQQVTSSAASSICSTTSSTASSITTTGTGMSELCQKNRILVKLLEKQMIVPPAPLPIPTSSMRAYGPGSRPRVSLPQHTQHQQHSQHPQHQQQHQQHMPHPQHVSHPHQQRQQHSTLSNILSNTNHRVNNVNGGVGGGGAATVTNAECSPTVQSGQGGGGSGSAGGNSVASHSHLQMVLQGGGLQGGARSYPPQPVLLTSPIHYANTAPHHVYNNQPPSVSTRAQGGGGGSSGDSVVPNDQILSDILDEVINNMPDSDRPTPDVSGRQSQGTIEKNAVINAIRQSLMQCETVSKNSIVSSPGAPPVYSVQSSVSCNMVVGGGVYAGGGVGGAGGTGSGPGLGPQGNATRAHTLAEQELARLLQLQRSQHMLVSPEATEQPQSDLGSTINALVSETPPNVALTRTDYHHNLYQTSQMGTNYSGNKITTSQQNPMLSRQLSVPGSGSGGYGPSAAALHTPMSPQPYHRMPLPHPRLHHHAHAHPHAHPRHHLVGGYYEENAASYCAEYARCNTMQTHVSHQPHAHHPSHTSHDHQLSCAGNGTGASAGAGGTSEYVRNELRAAVEARSIRPDLHTLQPPELDSLVTFDMTPPGGGSVVVVGRASSASTNTWETQQSTSRASTTAGAVAVASVVEREVSEAVAVGDETESAGVAARTAPGAAAKASLLQKLLSQ